MTASGSSGGSAADLATMLAEMDSRLQALQRELEEVAVPITRRGVQPPNGTRPVTEPTAESAAQSAPDERAALAPADSSSAAPAPVVDSGRPAARPRRSRAVAPAPAAAEESLEAEPRPGPRKRGRRVTAVQGSPPASDAAPPPPPTVPPPSPPSSGAPHSAPAAERAAGQTARHAAEPVAADDLVRETILHAEQQARRIVEEARDRIGAVGTRTRELLEQSLAATGQAPGRRVRQQVRTSPSVEERAYAGTVTVEAGPFDDVGQLKAFEDALASIPGVVEVYIRTFERYYAHFALRIDVPTPLIAELRARIADPLRVIDATGEDPRLEIVRAGETTSTP